MNILIADDEIDILEIIEFLIQDSFSEKVNTFLAKNSIEAIEILSKEKIDLCVSDHNMPGGNGNEIFKHILDKKIDCLFVLCSTVVPKDMPNDYLPDIIFGNIQKPDIIVGIKKIADQMRNRNPISAAIYDLEMEFIPVSLELLLLLEKTPSELYIRISDSKFLKCLNSDVPFTNADNAKYLSKSVTKLYVKKPSDPILTTKLISQAIDRLMLKKSMPLDQKMSIVHEQLTGLIKFSGMTEEVAAITKNNISQAVSLIMQNELLANFWENLNLIGEYPSQLYSLHSMLSYLIAKKLSWGSEATIHKLTLAAFFQDITLNSTKTMQLYDYHDFLSIEQTLNSKEISNYLDHPTKASEVIKNLKEIPPDVDKIIIEQHEAPDGSGFPRKLNANQLGPLSCVFILSGLLARYILNEGENFQINNFIQKFESLGYSKGNFKEAFSIIKKMSK